MLLSRPQGAVHNMSDAMFEEAAECALCDKKFHAFRRKHRCRTCGSAVCGSCARSHKVLPSATIMRYNNEPVRVCDRCLRDQNQMLLERRRAEDVERARARQLAIVEEEQRMRAAEQQRIDQERAEQQARDRSRREMRLRQLEEKHLGPRPDRVRRARSLDDCARVLRRTSDLGRRLQDAEKRAIAMFAHPVAAVDEEKPPSAAAMASSLTPAATVVQEAEECALCLEPMEPGNAIYTTECGHSFHWVCLKEIQSSDTSNYDKCPSCRATMTEMQVKKHCDHPRVRIGHRFCRDCGNAVSERDAKPRPPESSGLTPSLAPTPPPPPTNQPVSYRASSHGALVRCPQCHIQMRVLPHMYNMRVACPSGHMFLVQVAGQQQSALGGSSRGYGYGHAPGVGGSSMGRTPMRGMNMGYPGSSYYRATNTYSEL